MGIRTLAATMCVLLTLQLGLSGCAEPSPPQDPADDAAQDMPAASAVRPSPAEDPPATTLDPGSMLEEDMMEEKHGYRACQLSFPRDGHEIYGQLYLPAGDNKSWPLVIIGHGFGATCRSTAPAARELARNGIAAYIFDFVGGSPGSASGGRTTDMSVLTEEADTKAVLDGLRSMSFVQKDNVFLMGESQGGFVVALLGAQMPDEVRGLILFYPALVIPDDARSRYPSLADTPETYNIMGMTVGRRYAEDVWDMDAVQAVQGYPGPVLIFHGDQDSIVPISYSEQAGKAYPNAELVTMRGAGHGFGTADFQEAMAQSIQFVKEHAAP